MSENSDLRHQLANKDAQLASLSRFIKIVTAKLQYTSFNGSSHSGDGFEHSSSTTGSMESLFQNAQIR